MAALGESGARSAGCTNGFLSKHTQRIHTGEAAFPNEWYPSHPPPHTPPQIHPLLSGGTIMLHPVELA
jgi:hypothetical protein